MDDCGDFEPTCLLEARLPRIATAVRVGPCTFASGSTPLIQCTIQQAISIPCDIAICAYVNPNPAFLIHLQNGTSPTHDTQSARSKKRFAIPSAYLWQWTYVHSCPIRSYGARRTHPNMFPNDSIRYCRASSHDIRYSLLLSTDPFDTALQIRHNHMKLSRYQTRIHSKTTSLPETSKIH